MGRITGIGAAILALLAPGMARADLSFAGGPQITSQTGDATLSGETIMISGSATADATNMGFATVDSSLTFTQVFRVSNAPGGEDVNFLPGGGYLINSSTVQDNFAHVSFLATVDQGVGVLLETSFNSGDGSGFSPPIITAHLAEGDYTLTETLSGEASIGLTGGSPPRPGTHADFSAFQVVGFNPQPVPEPGSLALLGLGGLLVLARRLRRVA